jgi:serine protease SohB
MSEFFLDYGLFLLKAATIVAGFVIVIGFVAALGRKGAQEGLEVESLNRRYKVNAQVLKHALLGRGEQKKEARRDKKRFKE